MATMKDIAKLAGVSYGTVSNVLNGRGNVSVEKMEVVLDAARQIGYSLNTQAQLLRANSNSKIAIILPNLTCEKYASLFNAIRQTIESQSDMPYDLFLTDDLQDKEIKLLNKIASGGYQSYITVSSLDDASIYFETLQATHEDVFFVYRKPKGTDLYFSLDYQQAAQAIIKPISALKPKAIGLYADDLKYRDSEEFVQNMRLQINKHCPEAHVVVQHSSDVEAYNTAFNFFEHGQSLDVVITQNIEKMRYITHASHFGSTEPCPPIYSLTGNIPPMINGIYCFPVNYTQLGQNVVERLLQRKKSVEKFNKRVPNVCDRLYSGIGQSSRFSEPVETLNLLTLSSPSTAALKKLLPNFLSQTGINVNLSVRTFGEIYSILDSMDDYPFYDLIRVDVAFFPWFAKKALCPLSDIGGGVTDLLSKYTPQKQERFSLVDATAYAMPFDASVQLLFYRKDLFENAVIKRMFFEESGKELKVPATFDEYDRICQFFNKHKEAMNPARPLGASATTGSAGIISSEYLLRYYAAGGRIINSESIPCLNVEIAERVLIDYIRQIPFVDRINSEWWGESISRFENGKLAMNIAYMNLFNDVAHSPIANDIGFAAVPGGIPQIGGGVLGASKFSEKQKQIERFYRWLYSDVIQDHILMLGGNTLQRSFINMQEIKQRYPWLPLAYEQMNAGVRESTTYDGRVFNLRLAETVIGNGVINALDGLVKPSEAISAINNALAAIQP